MKFALTQPPGAAFIHVWADVKLTFEIGRRHPGAEVETQDGLAKIGEIQKGVFHWYAWADRLTEEEKAEIREQTARDALTLLLITYRLSK